MTPKSWTEVKSQRLAAMTEVERARHERADVAELRRTSVKVFAAREEAGLGRRELARRTGTSQAESPDLRAGELAQR